MNEVLLTKFDFAWQADGLAEKLDAAGIKSTLISRPREYAVLVTGGPVDPVDVYVSENNLAQAKQILNDSISSKLDDEVIQNTENNYFKKVIIYSIFSFMFLPLVFNYAATVNFIKLSKQPAMLFKKIFAFSFLIFSWILAITVIAIVAKTFLY